MNVKIVENQILRSFNYPPSFSYPPLVFIFHCPGIDQNDFLYFLLFMNRHGHRHKHTGTQAQRHTGTEALGRVGGMWQYCVLRSSFCCGPTAFYKPGASHIFFR